MIAPRCNRCLEQGHLGIECPRETAAPRFIPGQPRKPLSERRKRMVPPSYTGPRRHASDDPWRFSGLPGPTRLNEGMTNAETIEWARERRRKESGT